MTEIVRFLKTFLKKIVGFFSKKNKFFIIVKSRKFAVECVSNDTISQKSIFHLKFEVFFGEKPEIFKFGKIEKYDEKGVFFSKKTTFSFF